MTTQDSGIHPLKLRAVHHIGVSVQNVDVAVAFWARFLGIEPTWRKYLDAAYLSDITGYPGVALDACVIEICGGVRLELLDYRVDNKTLNDMATANPGNVHICLEVEDIKTAWLHAIECGAESVSPNPVSLTSGPNAGASAGYLRVHDGLTVELVQAKA